MSERHPALGSIQVEPGSQPPLGSQKNHCNQRANQVNRVNQNFRGGWFVRARVRVRVRACVRTWGGVFYLVHSVHLVQVNKINRLCDRGHLDRTRFKADSTWFKGGAS